MLWFIAAAVGGFYAFWKKTAPTEAEVQAKAAAEMKALAQAEADADQAAATCPPDRPDDTLRGDASIVEVVDAAAPPPSNPDVAAYDPAANPFRDQAALPAPASDLTAGFRAEDGLSGSQDDILPDESGLEDYVDEEEYDGGE